VLSLAQLRTNLLVKLGEATGQTHTLPMVLFAPTARCNSRCLSCDWWRADGKSDLTVDEVRRLAAELPALGTKVVVFTGGEPLLRPDVMELAGLFRAQGLRLQLLTSGLALERHAAAIAERFEMVIVSLDGHTPELYQRIRGVDGLGVVTAGVKKLRALAPRCRCGPAAPCTATTSATCPTSWPRPASWGSIRSPSSPPTSARRPSTAGCPGQRDAGPAPRRGRDAGIRARGRGGDRHPGARLRRGPGGAGARRAAPAGAVLPGPAGAGAVSAGRLQRPWMSVMIEASGAVRPCFFHPPSGTCASARCPAAA
jgi:MoaA/NifB/PqqE/SkfB family radical SAM enzyme